MKYTPPIGAAESAPYVDANPSTGTEGSPVPAAAIEHPQREIVEVITQAGLTPDSGDLTQLFQAIQAMTGPGAPVGSIAIWTATTPPEGYLECNGAEVSRTAYAALFDVIGIAFGAGDGSTTFNLPDLRAEFLRGWDHGRGVDAGRDLGTWQADELREHSHATYRKIGDAGAGGQAQNVGTPKTGTTEPTGGDETRPRNVALMFCIKY